MAFDALAAGRVIDKRLTEIQQQNRQSNAALLAFKLKMLATEADVKMRAAVQKERDSEVARIQTLGNAVITKMKNDHDVLMEGFKDKRLQNEVKTWHTNPVTGEKTATNIWGDVIRTQEGSPSPVDVDDQFDFINVNKIVDGVEKRVRVKIDKSTNRIVGEPTVIGEPTGSGTDINDFMSKLLVRDELKMINSDIDKVDDSTERLEASLESGMISEPWVSPSGIVSGEISRIMTPQDSLKIDQQLQKLRAEKVLLEQEKDNLSPSFESGTLVNPENIPTQ